MRDRALLSRLAAGLAVVLSLGCATSVETVQGPTPPSPAAASLVSSHVPAVPALVRAAPAEVGMDPALGARLDSLVEAGLAAGAAPGASLAVGRYGRLVHLKSYGRIGSVAGSAPVTDSTRYDMASVTKVAAGTMAAMLLEESGQLDLDRPVSAYLPELTSPDKANVTVRQLLTHRGGFEAFAALYREAIGRNAYLERINARPLTYTPGDSSIYSDWDLVLTGLIIERLAGKPLDVFLQERVYGPLGMRETGYNPLASGPLPAGSDCRAAFRPDHPLLPQIAMTEVDTVYRHMHVHGIVHDENACALGGVAGHAGLFSSARDQAVLAQFLLNGGEYNGVRLLRPTTIARWTARQTARSSRALGWDTPSPGGSAGRYFSPRSFGHTGFTGTSIWVDPERGLFVVLLANRVDPTRANNRNEPLRRAIADAVQRAVLDAPLVEWR